MARPGMIFVRSGTSSPEFTLSDLTSWYEDLHIPAVLATRGVTAAARYQVVSTPAAGGNSSDEGRDGASTDLIYLTVYHVPDMNWLHTEDCEFWKLPLDVPGKEEGTRRSIFEVAKFETLFWELVGREDRVGDLSEGCGPGLCNTPEQGTRYCPRYLKSAGTKLTLVAEPPKQLILGCVKTIGHNEHVTQTLRRLLTTVSGGPFRCSILNIDESRPCPPWAKGQENDVADALSKWMGKNFCFFEYSGLDVDISWATPSNTQCYTLLSAYGDFSKTS